MNGKILLTTVAALYAATNLSPAAVLVTGQTSVFGGTNNTACFDFGRGTGATALQADRNTLAKWATGDSLSVSLQLTYSAFQTAGSVTFSMSFLSATTDTSIYADLRPVNDATVTPASGFLTRDGSAFLGNLGTTVTGTVVFDSNPPFTSTAGAGAGIPLLFSITRTGTTTYDFISRSGSSVISSQSGTFAANSIAASTEITRIGFRHNSSLLSSPSGSGITATFAPVPNPAFRHWRSAACPQRFAAADAKTRAIYHFDPLGYPSKADRFV